MALATITRLPLGPKNHTSLQIPLRRKASFIRHADSSEASPSPHSSIYEAYYISNPTSEDTSSPDGASGKDLIPRMFGDENNRIAPLLFAELDENHFRYGHGTILDTITEKTSNGTIRTLARAKSAEDLPTLLRRRRSVHIIDKLRRKQSFSVDDLGPINEAYHEACSLIERAKPRRAATQEIYAKPKIPFLAPPERPPTPPGLPSWTESQRLNRRAGSRQISSQSQTGNRLQRFFGLGSMSDSRSASISRAPRFRPPRSAYGNINSHPFAQAPVAKLTDMPTDSIFGTPSFPSSNRLERPTGRRIPGQQVPNPPIEESSELLSFHTAPSSPTPRPRSSHTTVGSTKNTQQCPHRRGRLQALKAICLTRGHDSNLYQTIPSNPFSENTSSSRFAPPFDPQTTSQPASGISVHPAEAKIARCWKCRVEHIFEQIDRFWEQSARWICFLCCGLNLEDMHDEHRSGNGIVARRVRLGGLHEVSIAA
ncbi:hypothetical protein BP5796_08920 [Coleophoma crateriformis]|uniref:Uncharacterized protein n=1 Tax=Coleophoma crateriformis TaxID=565419 RepID=A0A3D8R2I9_9HELO|nr:hypothetical protein BP5796_08920 [Coleophoma crateriformis]